MKKTIYMLYGFGMLFLTLFFCYLCFTVHNETFEARNKVGYTEQKEYETHRVKEKGLPAGTKTEYVFTLEEIPEGELSLVFYSIHQEVDVYIGDERVYSRHSGKDNPFGKSPGHCWNTIPLYQRDGGKQIRVEVIPVYKDIKDVELDFYIGSQYSIYLKIISRNFLQFLLGLIAVVIGLAFIVFTIYSRKNSDLDKGLLMMGMFSIHVGIWKISDMEAFALFTQKTAVLYYLPFFSLLLVIIPYILFIKELFSQKEHIVWYLVCYLACFVTVFSLVMQITGRADLRQTLWMTHANMIAMVVVIVTMVVKEWHIRGWNNQLKTMVICMGLCLAGLLSDLAVYYISGGTSIMVLGMFGFLTYIIILGIMSIRETKRLIQMGMKAKRYERMAYHDQLTGLYNRTAYAEHTGSSDFTPQNCIAVMFDLNNLKICNDTMGHEQGDRYIMCGTAIIKKAFEDLGSCYRMGGDEFCVLLKDVSLKDCEKRVHQLKNLMEEHNKEHPEEFPIKIACGYEIYDEEIDFDFGDTLRRADKMMYREKFSMKTGERAGSLS